MLTDYVMCKHPAMPTLYELDEVHLLGRCTVACLRGSGIDTVTYGTITFEIELCPHDFWLCCLEKINEINNL